MGTNRGGGSRFKSVRGGQGMLGTSPGKGTGMKSLNNMQGSAKVHDRLYLGQQKPKRRSRLAGFVSGMVGRARRFSR